MERREDILSQQRRSTREIRRVKEAKEEKADSPPFPGRGNGRAAFTKQGLSERQ